MRKFRAGSTVRRKALKVFGSEGGNYLRLRVLFILGAFLLFFAAIFFRAFELQVLDAGKLERMAESQHRSTIEIQSKRGGIYDRNLKELAVSVEVDSVYARPGKIADRRSVARAIAPVLSMREDELRRILGSGKFVWLRRQVDLNDADRALISGIEGLGVVKESRRFYPNRTLASNLVGFTGVDSEGLEGVERLFNDVLDAGSFKVAGERDARGSLIMYEDAGKRVPLEGMEVTLTIDKTIQYIAEKELQKAVTSSGARGGSVVVMDPVTGEVLAMANYPTFDPNNFRNYSPQAWRNRAITDTFEPGSVFKVFVLASAFDEGRIGRGDVFFCENGSYRVHDRVFHDVKKYGYLTPAEIIKYSSNICSAKVGEKLGKEKLYWHTKQFGFGERTGIDLPGEVSGTLRHFSDWSRVTLHTVSFGQGVSSTGVQLIAAMSAIANGGFLMKPYVVKEIKGPDGRVVKESSPAIRRRVVSKKTAELMTEMLVGVATTGGTGTRASIEGFEVAGKTATAQKPDLERGGYLKGAFISSFLGFVPARNPDLAILVTIDEPKGSYHGGEVAAPAFKEIASQSLSYLGIFPDPPQEESPLHTPPQNLKERVRTVSASPDVTEEGGVPDFTGKTVRLVLRIAKERDVPVRVMGTGVAVKQDVSPGDQAAQGRRVTVWFQ